MLGRCPKPVEKFLVHLTGNWQEAEDAATLVVDQDNWRGCLEV
jgi:hypothetical protein